MLPRRTAARGALLTALVLVTLPVAVRWLRTPDPAPTPVPSAFPAEAEAERRGREIRLFQARAAEDPTSAADHARLAGLYLLRARETGSGDDYQRAEQSARTSLALRTAHNLETWRVLAASLLDQHRFEEAREAARTLVTAEPSNPWYRALLGEIELEMGDYDGAARTFRSLWPLRRHLAVAPPLARWEEANGRIGRARRLLQDAREEARHRSDLSPEQVAWFHFRAGDFDLQYGRWEDAEAAFREGLAVRPGDHRIEGARARLAAVRHDWTGVIRHAAAMGDAIDLATMALVGDAFLALGDTAVAERWFGRVEAAAEEAPEPFNRQLHAFRLDHDRRIDETLMALQGDVATRKDALGYDLLAWASYKAGELRAAREASRTALGLGATDPFFLFHAGMIEAALGDGEEARRHLERALDVNPRFHPRYADVARTTLEELGRNP